jgi:hypothetical protein
MRKQWLVWMLMLCVLSVSVLGISTCLTYTIGSWQDYRNSCIGNQFVSSAITGNYDNGINRSSSIAEGSNFQPISIDVNGDLINELVGMNANYLKVWYINPSTNVLTLLDDKNLGVAQSQAMNTLGDIDGDGDNDFAMIVTNKIYTLEYDFGLQVENIKNVSGGGTIDTAMRCITNTSNIVKCYMGMFRTASTNSSIIEWIPSKNVTNSYTASIGTGYHFTSAPVFVDLNRDGYLDLAMTFHSGEIFVWDTVTKSYLSSFGTRGKSVVFCGNAAYGIVAYNTDGSGDPELVETAGQSSTYSNTAGVSVVNSDGSQKWQSCVNEYSCASPIQYAVSNPLIGDFVNTSTADICYMATLPCNGEFDYMHDIYVMKCFNAVTGVKEWQYRMDANGGANPYYISVSPYSYGGEITGAKLTSGTKYNIMTFKSILSLKETTSPNGKNFTEIANLLALHAIATDMNDDGSLDTCGMVATGSYGNSVKCSFGTYAAPVVSNNVSIAFYDNEQYLLHGTFVPLQGAKVCVDSSCKATSIVGKATFNVSSLTGHSLNASLSGYNDWRDAALSLYAVPSDNVYFATKLPALQKSVTYYPDIDYLLLWEEKFNFSDVLSHYGWYPTAYNSLIRVESYQIYGKLLNLNGSVLHFTNLKHQLFYAANDNYFSGDMVVNGNSCSPPACGGLMENATHVDFVFHNSAGSELFRFGIGKSANDSSVIGAYYNYSSGKYHTCFFGNDSGGFPFSFKVEIDSYARHYRLYVNDDYTKVLGVCASSIPFSSYTGVPAYLELRLNQDFTDQVFLDNLRSSDFIGVPLPNASLGFNTMLSVYDYSSNSVLSGAAFNFYDLSGNTVSSGVTDDTGVGYANVSMGQIYCLNITKSGYNIYKDCAVNATFNFYSVEAGDLFAKNAYLKAITPSCNNYYMIKWADDFGYVFVPEQFGWNSGGNYNSGYYTADFGNLGKMLRFDGLGNAISHGLYLSTSKNRIIFEVLMKAYVTSGADSNVLYAYLLNSNGQQSVVLRFYTADESGTEVTHFQYWNGATSAWVEMAEQSSASPVNVRVDVASGLVNIDLDLNFNGQFTTYASQVPVVNSGSLASIMFLPQYVSNPNNDLFVDNVFAMDYDSSCAGQYGGTGNGTYSVPSSDVCNQYYYDPVSEGWKYDSQRCEALQAGHSALWNMGKNLFRWSIASFTQWSLTNFIYFVILIVLIIFFAPLILKGLEILKKK